MFFLERTTPGSGHLSPRGMNGRNYVYLIIILLHIKHTSFGYSGFKEEDFPMQITTPRDVVCTNPRGTVGKICKEGHYT